MSPGRGVRPLEVDEVEDHSKNLHCRALFWEGLGVLTRPYVLWHVGRVHTSMRMSQVREAHGSSLIQTNAFLSHT